MMRSKIAHSIAALAVAGGVVLASSPASAQWHRWNRGGGWGWGAPVAGFAAGAIIGGALASRPYYGYPAYGYPVYEEPAYGYAAAPADDSVAYCQSTYRSYDVASGTYLGYDGLRHPCP